MVKQLDLRNSTQNLMLSFVNVFHRIHNKELYITKTTLFIKILVITPGCHKCSTNIDYTTTTTTPLITTNISKRFTVSVSGTIPPGRHRLHYQHKHWSVLQTDAILLTVYPDIDLGWLLPVDLPPDNDESKQRS